MRAEQEKEDKQVQLIVGVIMGVSILSLLTHIVTCITEEAYTLLLAGVVFFPVGIIHGIGIWLGMF